ncbi:MAG: oxaloacetate decarboxylase [Rhodospirillaceae bacterium]|jgi:2-methylisocitrate lyase-like PEP mutase family enzyme|nr:oxaloacetate decarboxylase [Rhodospirillaceae bacterium]MBT5899304.1 oxaloacetate decarboxylase [Rhodospirillaceae bacterium]MBT6429641.1 oxaloacetate decarboxylase [Rhodospirillaceae bacterium]MBT7759024.1 oxaloacetate decarboxylase [Rhodospirillaceae bacterium]
MSKLREQLHGTEIVVAPGIYDAFGALMVERAGFPAAYLSGASIAYTRYGRPDLGLVGMDEVAAVLSAIGERVEIPLIVDADTGYGNALNVIRTVKLFERNGAGVIQLEDQSLPKRCGHLAGKTLVSGSEMVGKIKAALDARQSENTLIMARTDAIAVEGLEPTLERAERYREAGADILFVEAPQTVDDMRTVTARLGKDVPLLANMVEGGKTPLLPASELQEVGYSLVIFPGGLARAVGHLMGRYFASLQTHGDTAQFRGQMIDFDEMNALIGTPEMLAAGDRYDAGKFEAND